MKIKTDTIIRTIVLAIALINQVLAIYGREAIPITEDNVYQLVTLLVTIGAAVWSWWKNNSFTNEYYRRGRVRRSDIRPPKLRRVYRSAGVDPRRKNYYARLGSELRL